jgi:hypothetical protein
MPIESSMKSTTSVIEIFAALFIGYIINVEQTYTKFGKFSVSLFAISKMIRKIRRILLI